MRPNTCNIRYNNSAKNIEATAKVIFEEFGHCVKQFSLLSYHQLGETKSDRLEVHYSVSISPPSEEHLQEFQMVFGRFGLSDDIGR